MDPKPLITQLDKIPLGRMYHASAKAVTRLQIYFIGRTHELFLEFGNKARAAISRQIGSDSSPDGATGFELQSRLIRLWSDTFTEWQTEFQQVRREAGLIPFGVLAMTHERMIRPMVKGLDESKNGQDLIEAVTRGGVFSPQVQALIDVASNYLYGGTPLNLSQRIWKLDRDTRDLINNVLMSGIANQLSAWQIAEKLEQALGAGADCPRWTSTRLYGMTAVEKLSSTAGLLSGKSCDGSGVSYNALRLARTEIAKMHALATDKMMAMQPWVEKEQVHLSAAHPEHDECDDVVEGGENGEGIYPKGEIELPIHPVCFCYKTAVLMDQKEFTSRLRGWMRGETEWSALDKYARELGIDTLDSSLSGGAAALAIWLLGDKLTEWLK